MPNKRLKQKKIGWQEQVVKDRKHPLLRNSYCMHLERCIFRALDTEAATRHAMPARGEDLRENDFVLLVLHVP
jgi:hypothetical protein